MYVVEFQGSFCHVFAWQSVKNSHVLKSLLTVPLEKAEGDSSTQAKPSAASQRNGAAIRQALRAANLKVREALAIIPKQWVTLRIVTLPSTDPTEVSEMARFEAERHIPFNVERHVVSHHVLRLEGIQGAQVVIAALDGPPAWEITATMDAAGIHLTCLEVSTLALFNALTYSGAWDTGQHPTAAQIHVGMSATDITILQRGVPIFARSIALGVEKLFASLSPDGPAGDNLAMMDRIEEMDVFSGQRAEAAEDSGASFQTPEADSGSPQSPLAVQNWVNRLVQEIRKTHEFANREFECQPISQLFYSGAGLCLRGLKDVLREQLQVPLTEIDPYVKGLRIEQGPPSLRLPPFAYAAAAGAIARDMSEDSVRINLLPSDYVRSHDTTKRKRSLILTGSLAAALVICALVYANLQISSKQRQLEKIRAQADNGAPREKQIRERKSQIKILKDQSKPEGTVMAILNDMSSWKDLFNPNEMHVAITDFQYTAGKTLGLSGTAMSYGEMNDLTVQLKSTRHFSDVKVESWGRDQNWYPGNVQPIRFKLNCYLGKTEQKGKKKEVEPAVASTPAAEQPAGKTP